VINPRRLDRQEPTQRLQQFTKRLREPRIAALVGVGIAVVVVAVLLVSGGSDSHDDNGGTGGTSSTTSTSGGGGTSTQATKPIEASVDRLLELSSVVGHPVYWAGARPGKKYELTITSDQNIFIRYLDPSVPIGSKDVSSLTVGTYPVQDGMAALQHEANKPGASTDTAPGGGFVLTSTDAPQSVYLAYPDSNYEIEIYDPSPQSALKLATSGAIVPIS
jgi:hypothetical protein